MYSPINLTHLNYGLRVFSLLLAENSVSISISISCITGSNYCTVLKLINYNT